MTHPFLSTGRAHVLAHRGATADVPPGNTADAFARAVALGVDHLETDVQLSADGEVVIFHDERLDEITTGSGAIGDHPWEALRVLNYRHGDEVTPHRLMRLADALDRWTDMYWNIDVKVDEAVEPVVEMLQRLELRDNVCVAAFGFRRQRRLRSLLGAGWCSAHSRNEIAVLRLAATLRVPLPRFGNVVQAPVAAHGFTIVDRRFVDACTRRGIAVHVWTVNEPDEMRRLLSIGVDAIITDDPASYPQPNDH